MRRWIVLLVTLFGLTLSFAAFAQEKTADQLEASANEAYKQKDDAKAYADYTEWLDKYGKSSSPQKIGTARARLKEIEGRTGTLAIDVSEPGANVSVDDHPVGVSPLKAPVRLGAGPHRVSVTKDGFTPWTGAPNVVLGAPATVTVKLEAAASTGKVSVKEKTGKAVTVTVDGKEVGPAPWTGDVEPGDHEIGARSATAAAPAQKVTVVRGKELSVELAATSTTAPLRIGTNDGKGLIYIDDKLVGEGSYSAEIPAGPHKIRITREGYDPFEEEVVLKDKEPFARSVVLKLVEQIHTGPVQKASRALEGWYGGFQFLGALVPSGFGSGPEKTCDSDKPDEVTSCDSGSPIGAGFGGFFGHHWDPVGVELFLLGQYEETSPSLVWKASSTDPGIGPDPARTESFKLRRVGGLGALRVRYTLQGEKLRFSVAGGVGLSTRTIFLERDTQAANGDPNAVDKLVSDGQSYWSFALVLEPSIQYRITEGVAVMLGFSLIADNPTSLSSDPPRTSPEGNHRLATSGLTTPAYDLSSAGQIWTGLFLGMMFGP